MVRHLIKRLPFRGGASDVRSRPKLFFDDRPELIYAIGDIHGCYPLLRKMEQLIVQDAASVSGEKWIILLGDYIDRGPESAAVLDHLLGPPPSGFERFCLAGNHEDLMLSYLDHPDPGHHWLRLGGRETLRSFGLDPAGSAPSMKALLENRISPEHVEFLRSAPSLLSVPNFTFVHGGIRRGVPLAQQSDEDLLWLRPELGASAPSDDFLIVHGHTPVRQVEVCPGRINIDTGAFASGMLSGLKIDRSNKLFKLAVS
ncbi:metallophosphoesterase [Neorhizobium sp. T786]|uniref:metallophosphoesterase n=1 Tax=Pseudorhizobium xiangyangii TaxID=2883104 RepID=UPI001CFFB200|nr:metallophosphoesterase [Neorhizobium xiangyangii]MCB5203124.1 metallophosphoesterase [Neorhizobium xiangyangii]